MKGSTELPKSQLSRRKFLGSAFAGTAATLVGAASMGFFIPHPLSPKAISRQPGPEGATRRQPALHRRTLHQLRRGQADLRDRTVEKQQPFAALLSCADSRVPIEIIFDQSIGELFVTRVAGNIATPEIIASLEYGAAVLGTKVIMVLGHSGCGAVKAAIAGKEVPGQISALFPPLRPAVDQAGSDLAATTKKNASIQATLLSEASRPLSYGERRQTEDRRRLLRPRHRQSHAGLTHQSRPGRRRETWVICARSQASDTSRCRGHPASGPASAREDPRSGAPRGSCPGSAIRRSSLRCRSGE